MITFKAFGLTISSCIHCPELLPGAGVPDVTVIYGAVPSEWPDAKSNGGWYQAVPGQLLLRINGIARFLIRNGSEIVIDRHADASDDEVRLFLLGSAFGALMHQRGILVLHGSTIKTEHGCVVFLGRSGVGKSTLATALRHRGYTCLGDDLCAVSVGADGVPNVAPAYPQAKLWVDVLRHIGIDEGPLRRIRPSLEKRALPFEGNWGEERIPLKRLYVLSPEWDKVGILSPVLLPVVGPRKIKVLRDYTYRVEYLAGLDLAVRHFKQIAYLAARLPVLRVVRPNDGFVVDELASAVESDFRLDDAPSGWHTIQKPATQGCECS